MDFKLNQALLTASVDYILNGHHVLLSPAEPQVADELFSELADAFALHPEITTHSLDSLTPESVMRFINRLFLDLKTPTGQLAVGAVVRHAVLVRADASDAALDALSLLTRLAKDMRVLAVRWLVCGSGWRDAAPRGGWVTSVVLLPPEAAISTPDIFSVDVGSGWDLPTQSPNAPTFSGGPYTRLVWIFTFLSAIAVVIYVLDL